MNLKWVFIRNRSYSKRSAGAGASLPSWDQMYAGTTNFYLKMNFSLGTTMIMMNSNILLYIYIDIQDQHETVIITITTLLKNMKIEEEHEQALTMALVLLRFWDLLSVDLEV